MNMYNVYIEKTKEEENVKINFVGRLKGFQTEIYFNKKKDGYIHRKMIYSNLKLEPLKKNSQRRFKIDTNQYKYIIIVEEESLKPPKYTVFIEYSLNIEPITIETNHIITKSLLECINKAIHEENELNERYKEYATLPEGVKNCIPFDDFEPFEEAISKNTWYSRQVYRLNCLPFILESKLVKNWLSMLGIYSVSKKQEDLDCLAVYVAKRLTTCLPHPEKEILVKKLSKLKKKYA